MLGRPSASIGYKVAKKRKKRDETPVLQAPTQHAIRCDDAPHDPSRPRALADYAERGWMLFGVEKASRDWAAYARPLAAAALSDPRHAERYKCAGTWFCGTNVLDNDEHGALPGGPPLAGAAVDFVHRHLCSGPLAWDRAQVSVCFPGFPRQAADETDASFRFRVKRDGAHLDGLMAEGPEKRRVLREHHAFLLGLPLNDAGAGCAPFVVWEESHDIIREMLREQLGHLAPPDWPRVDLKRPYNEARKRVFEECRRVTVVPRKGEAVLVDRHVIHGTAPWSASAADTGPNASRMIAFFRPQQRDLEAWLDAGP